MYVSVHASILIKPGHIWDGFRSDPDYYLGQWVIWVSDVDPVSMLDQSRQHANSLKSPYVEALIPHIHHQCHLQQSFAA